MTDFFGLRVHLCMGVTDVDDKIINKARARCGHLMRSTHTTSGAQQPTLSSSFCPLHNSNIEPTALARRYEQEFWEVSGGWMAAEARAQCRAILNPPLHPYRIWTH
jgi:cysteinyl-tRNA synthetase